MKTAEQVLLEHSALVTGTGYKNDAIISAMKKYALQAIEHDRQRIIENAEAIAYRDDSHRIYDIGINEQSIHSIEIELP